MNSEGVSFFKSNFDKYYLGNRKLTSIVFNNVRSWSQCMQSQTHLTALGGEHALIAGTNFGRNKILSIVRNHGCAKTFQQFFHWSPADNLCI